MHVISLNNYPPRPLLTENSWILSSILYIPLLFVYPHRPKGGKLTLCQSTVIEGHS